MASKIETADSCRRELSALLKRGLLREVYRQGGLSQGQFAQLMEELRGR